MCAKNKKQLSGRYIFIFVWMLCVTIYFAVIERVIVAEKVRGKGYGAMLMRHAENVAISKGALKIMLSSAAKREEAHRFYEILGYDSSSSKVFKKYL